MKKIQVTIRDNTLIIGFKIENNTFKNIDNTNIITKDDLIFDVKYFKNNLNLIAGFLSVMVNSDNVTQAIIEHEDLIIISLEFLDHLPNITELVIQPDVSIDFDMHLAILKNDTLKMISCYNIPTYLLERIDTTKNVKIVTRTEVFFVSNFLRKNRLTSYSDVYYKRKISIDYEFKEVDFKDFDQFLSINMHLKTIYFEYIDLDLVKNVVRYLKENDKKNITISIAGTPNNLAYFNSLEDYVKKNKYIKKSNIKFKIDYTKEYKLDNFLKLLNFTSVKYILLVVIVSCVIGYGINEYDIYRSSTEIDSITDNIADLLEEFEYLEGEPGTIEPEPEPEPDPIEPETPTQPTTPQPVKPVYVSPYYKNYARVLSVLKTQNPDTVGWLTVNNTTVNYPVVQSTNNSYYLNHDFNKNSNSLGWVFMDYRNSPYELDQNTVIYGHNLARDKIMFGNLSATLDPNWYTKANNQYVTFNTSSGDMQWRIFSIYIVATTNDYLNNVFVDQNEFLSFANMIKSRSIHDFGVEIKENDKILTLSTCQNNGKSRLVVHAVLVQ